MSVNKHNRRKDGWNRRKEQAVAGIVRLFYHGDGGSRPWLLSWDGDRGYRGVVAGELEDDLSCFFGRDGLTTAWLALQRCGLPLERAGLGTSLYFIARTLGSFAGGAILLEQVK